MKNTKGQHYTVAIMTGSVQSDYAQEMIRGFYAGAKEENVNLVLLMGPQIPTSCADIVTSSVAGNDTDQFNLIFQYSHFIKPDAVILTYGALTCFETREDKDKLLKELSDVPCLVMEDTSFGDRIPCLMADNYGGMRACIKHLIVDHGYRRISFLSGPKDNSDAQERLRAYLDTMAEYKLEVTEGMVAYGDYTDRVDEQILYLLEHTPGLEAIACADDVMADACYRVLGMQNLIVGKNIAITGFDDTDSAGALNPPLTSVSQNNFQVSYTAIKNVVAMCRGEKVMSTYIPAVLRRRCSCGCSPMRTLNARYIPQEEMRDFIEASVGEMTSYLFATVSYARDRKYLSEILSAYCFYIYETVLQDGTEAFHMSHLMGLLKKLISYPYLSNKLLLNHLQDFLQILLANAGDPNISKLMSSILSSTQQYVHSYNMEKLQAEIYASDRKAWFVPMFTRELAGKDYMSNPEGIFFHVMTALKKMLMKRAYFFLFDKTVYYEEGEWLDFPEEIGLVAYFDAEEMKFYRKAEQIKFSGKEGFMSFIDDHDLVNLAAVNLFSENHQYGLALCEVEVRDIPFLQICSVQLGTLFHFIEVNQLEQQVQEQLESSLRIIQEQNRILSFLSEYDELTKLLNRRGFIERALTLYEESQGKRAALIFGDLDHLKEINDRFGHAEGDVAINTIAGRFTEVLPKEALIGRIGGDEFVAFVLTEEEDFGKRVEQELAEESRRFNARSDKPYYIELSVGVYEFVCDPQEDFNTMLQRSDQLLYRAKAARRKTAIKETGKQTWGGQDNQQERIDRWW